MIAGEASVDFLDLFVPVLACIVLALVLSGLLAAWGSRSFLRPLGKIDISRPDERDVEEEIKQQPELYLWTHNRFKHARN